MITSMMESNINDLVREEISAPFSQKSSILTAVLMHFFTAQAEGTDNIES